jgi:hypothetical protein
MSAVRLAQMMQKKDLPISWAAGKSKKPRQPLCHTRPATLSLDARCWPQDNFAKNPKSVILMKY